MIVDGLPEFSLMRSLFLYCSSVKVFVYWFGLRLVGLGFDVCCVVIWFVGCYVYCLLLELVCVWGIDVWVVLFAC